MEPLISFVLGLSIQGVSFFVFLVVFIVLLLKLHKNKNSQFYLDSLFVDDSGRASTSKMGELVSLVVSTWIIVHMALGGNITYDIFGIYLAAWTLNRGIRHFVNNKYRGESSRSEDIG